jgi:hypothetical protein
MSTPHEKIDSYLRQVRAGLRDLPDAEITEILNELRAHIMESSANGADNAAVVRSLKSLGWPEQIAAQYMAENLALRAEARRTPWTILRSLFYWATLSVTGFASFALCLIGYAFGACFLLAALMKPIHPQGVGVWVSNDPHLYSLHVGGFTGPAAQEREVLGWWMVPVGCSLGGGTILLTTHFALWGLRRLRVQSTFRQTNSVST